MMKRDVVQKLKYTYDFAKQGGAIGAIAMRPWVEGVQLAEGMVVKNFSLHVEAPLTSAGTPTVLVGNGADDDGYAVNAWGILSVANSVLKPGVLDGALIWDTTADAIRGYRIGAAANTQNVLLTVGAAALTGGRLVMYFDVLLPSAASA